MKGAPIPIPSWYVPISWVLNLYVAAVSLAFLIWMIQSLRAQRNIWAAALLSAAICIGLYSARGLWRIRPGGILPRFSSYLDAGTAFLPTLAGGITVTLFIIATRRDRGRRRRALLVEE